MNQRTLVLVAALLAMGASTALAQAPAAKWGDLTGQFIYGGPPVAAPKPVVPAGAAAVGCAGGKLVDETLLVNPKNNGVANIAVWLFPAAGAKVDIHPNYAAALAQPVKVANVGCRFDPHITFVRVGQKLEITNGDPTGHNTKIDTLNNPPINPILPVGGKVDVTYANEETLPSTVSCAIHTWMTGRVLVKDHPYVAVSDADGKFTFKDLPAGDWNFKVWHESGGYAKEMNKAALKKGVWAVTVKPGANDAGQLTVKL